GERDKSLVCVAADAGARVGAQLAASAEGLGALRSAPPPAAPEVPWEGLLASLRESVAARRDEGEGATQWLQSLPEAMRGAFEPVLAHLADGQERQAQLNSALVQILDLLRTKLAEAPA